MSNESIKPPAQRALPSHLAKDKKLLDYHIGLLKPTSLAHDSDHSILSPILTGNALRTGALHSAMPQYGLLAGIIPALKNFDLNNGTQEKQDPRIFFNLTPPSSTFICGSQGSGKSHTLSCMLENCLIPSDLGRLPRPLMGVVFHYDTFISDNMGSPCEAAFLASDSAVKVRVLCSPTNIRSIKFAYSRFKNIDVQPLEIDQEDLNTKRMLDLMAVESSGGTVPLYMHTLQRILREMRISQQQTGSKFDYLGFKRQILGCGLTPAQLDPLKQRLDTLESFMPRSQTTSSSLGPISEKKIAKPKGTQWTPTPGHLTIVDLSCPCISPETACGLFNICLSIFLEQDPTIGRVVALDEAHKYMNSSSESDTFTNNLLSAVRLQRHLGVRIIISTQEPTVSTALLNLCSTTIVHRFTSPEWLRVLRKHLAAAADDSSQSKEESDDSKEKGAVSLFNRIVRLNIGEALLFSPSAMVDSQAGKEGDAEPSFRRLGDDFLNIRIRKRLTEDGGRSILSS